MAGTWPVTAISLPSAASPSTSTSSRRRCTSCGGGLVLRRRLGRDLPEVGRGVAVARCGIGRRGEGHVGVGGDRRGDAVEHGLVGRAVDAGGQVERPVEARAEAVGQQVVGLPGGGVLGEVALVGEAEPQAEGGHGQHEQHQRRPPMAAGHGRCWMKPAPPVGERLRASASAAGGAPALEQRHGEAGEQHDGRRAGSRRQQRLRPSGRAPTRPTARKPGGDDAPPPGDLDALAGEAEQGRQQGERGQHGHEHHDGRARRRGPG